MLKFQKVSIFFGLPQLMANRYQALPLRLYTAPYLGCWMELLYITHPI
jgi:hypothetical protein